MTRMWIRSELEGTVKGWIVVVGFANGELWNGEGGGDAVVLWVWIIWREKE